VAAAGEGVADLLSVIEEIAARLTSGAWPRTSPALRNMARFKRLVGFCQVIAPSGDDAPETFTFAPIVLRGSAVLTHRPRALDSR
jgi:hypothetical protein